MEIVKVGIIGGGLMGREAASAFGRWFALNDFPVKPELTAVCDLSDDILKWYKQIPTVSLLTKDYKELLASDVDVVYVALPHNLHESVYLDVFKAGKDLLGEKPFGIDLAAAQKITEAGEQYGRFVRCSSEFPFLPGALKVINAIQSGSLGRIIQIKAGFLHSSDLNPNKPINWKRQNKFCGEIGVMGDLGMHVAHIPLRLGWQPKRVYAQLQKIYAERPDGKGGMAACDTWDNAQLHTVVDIDGAEVPMTCEMKRIAPGETNTWYIEVTGLEGGVRYSTKEPKTFWSFRNAEEQIWQRIDLGFQTQFSVITGHIFEPGFSDCFMQMLAAYFAERAGKLGNKFNCVTPQEAVDSHKFFAAALKSAKTNSLVEITQNVLA
ncbi:MAG TPA: Gfo/Idh/MocA family oxidoreductase [Cytophagaceae bacterium]|jgi:predicted dehydrogenase